MSTELSTLKGKIQDIDKSTRDLPIYVDTEINLTRFYGGVDRGTSLQIGFITLEGNYSYVQLDNENLKELRGILQAFFP